jgi:hypothetical protein
MIIIEFENNITYGLNILKYRDINDDNWYYVYIDIETLNILLRNFGIISTLRLSTQKFNIDNPCTSKNIIMSYCNTNIQIYCGNNTYFYLPKLEENF